MNNFFALLAHHGYLFIFLAVFAEAIGLPFPAALALVAAGSAAATGSLSAPVLLVIAIGGFILGDIVLFFMGRLMGWALLGFLCKLSLNPEACILNSAESFYKRGKVTLVFAKFVPGLNTMAPPLAGSMKMRPRQFLLYDFAGASLYVLTYGLLGFMFRDFLMVMTRGIQTTGHVFSDILVAAVVVYVAYRLWVYQKNKVYRVVPRIQVEELARRMTSEEKDNIIIVDVRSHGYYDAKAQRMKGSIRIEPNDLERELKALPKDKDIYVYCT
ncbi:MAG: VTT domain-containing protein [Acidobacteriota bacterium]|nr:VTT domain-containing protein [Acidobacteriota bacterium]